MVRQEVIKAVKVSGGARFWRCGGGRLAGATDQQMDSLSAGLGRQRRRSGFLDFTTHVRGKKGVTDLTPHLYDLCSLLWGPVAQVLLVDG